MPINNSKINFVSQHEKYICQNGITYHEICAFLKDIKAEKPRSQLSPDK